MKLRKPNLFTSGKWRRLAAIAFYIVAPTSLVFGNNFFVAIGGYSTAAIEDYNSQGVGTVFTTTGLYNPSGLAVDTQGNVYVANNSSSSQEGGIEKFNSQGQLLSSTPLNYATGLAFDNSGDLYACTITSISKITAQGTAMPFATVSPSSDLWDITFGPSGNLYATDEANKRILEFNSQGTSSVFATTGLYNPTGLAFDNSGDLYVATLGNTILKYDPQGDMSVFATAIPASAPLGAPTRTKTA